MVKAETSLNACKLRLYSDKWGDMVNWEGKSDRICASNITQLSQQPEILVDVHMLWLFINTSISATCFGYLPYFVTSSLGYSDLLWLDFT